MKRFLKSASTLIITSLLASIACAADEDPQTYCPSVGGIKQVGVDRVVFDDGKWVAAKMKAQYPNARGYWTLAVFPFADQGTDKILLKANEALGSLVFKDVYAGGGHGGAYFICEYMTTASGKILTAWAVYEGEQPSTSSLNLSSKAKGLAIKVSF